LEYRELRGEAHRISRNVLISGPTDGTAVLRVGQLDR
jgi:hypothetical protein